MLGKVTNFSGGSHVALTGIAFFNTGEHFHQRRFTGTVGSHKNDAVTTFDKDIEILVENVVVISLVDVLKRNNPLGRTGWLRKVEVEKFTGLPGLGKLVHLIDHLDPALHLRGLRTDGTEFIDKLLNACDLLLLVQE